MIEKLDWRKWK